MIKLNMAVAKKAVDMPHLVACRIGRIALALALLLSAPAYAAPPPPGPVDVNVTNTSLPVSVINSSVPVQVLNGLSVKAADNPALQAVQIKFDLLFGTEQTSNGSTSTIYTVPTGKRLVIEYIDGQFMFSPAQNSARSYWKLGIHDPNADSSTDHPIATTTETGPCTLTQSCVVISKPVRIYVEPGSSLYMTFGYSLNQAPFNAGMNGTINGYLVDVN